MPLKTNFPSTPENETPLFSYTPIISCLSLEEIISRESIKSLGSGRSDTSENSLLREWYNKLTANLLCVLFRYLFINFL